jgi:hypothetical protein
MKKLLLGAILGFGLTASIAFTAAHYDAKNSTAEVNRIEGLLIFSDCKPVIQYDYLGTVKSNTGGFGNAQYEGVRNRLIKNAKKEFPTADAIIVYMNNGQADKADCIKFK